MILEGLHLFAGGRGELDDVIFGQQLRGVGAFAADNVIDLAPAPGNQMSDLACSADLFVVIRAIDDFAAAGDATVQFQLVQASDEDLITDLDLITASDFYPHSEVRAGVSFDLKWQPTLVPRRYVGLRVVVAGAALTAGSIFAATALDRDSLGPIFNTRWTIA